MICRQQYVFIRNYAELNYSWLYRWNILYFIIVLGSIYPCMCQISYWGLTLDIIWLLANVYRTTSCSCCRSLPLLRSIALVYNVLLSQSLALSLGLSSCDDSSVAAEISLLLDVFCFISRSTNVSGQQQFTLNRKKQLFLGCEKVSKFCSAHTNAYVYTFIR